MKRIMLMFIAIMVTGLSYAQDSTKVDTTIKASIELDGIEVVSTRADDKMPVTQKTISGVDIKETYQGQEMSMILDKTPSVASSTDGGHPNGYTYFRLRGIDQTRINMTLNGVPLNEPEDQGVYFSNYPGFAENIKSMQIQRGVGTSTNGVASYAGSIDFETPTGREDTSTTVAVGYGSFNTQRFSASNSTGLKKNVSLYTNFSTYNTNGYKNSSGGDGHSFFLGAGYYGKKDVIKVTAFSGRTTNKMAWFAVSETDIANDPKTNYNSSDADDDFAQSFVQVQHTRYLASKSTITSTVYYNRLDGQWDLDLAPLGAGTDILNFQLASNLYGVMSNYKYNGNKLRVILGVHGNMYDRRHAMAILPQTSVTLYTNTGFKNEASTFLKASYDLGNFTLFGDAQLRYVTFTYDGAVQMEDVDWTFFNPKGGVNYTINHKSSLYVSVGQSHREPTRTDMFAGEDDLIAYNEVTPEEVIDYELGYKLKGKKLLVNANVYYMDFKNEITLIGALGSNGLPLLTNVETSFRSGVELDVAYAITKQITVSNNTNVSYNRINDGGVEFQPLYTPPVVSNTGITYKEKGFSIGVDAKYHSESFIDFDNDYTTPAFLVLNANAGYTYKNYNLNIQVINLTSENYYTNGYAMGTERYFFVNAPLSAYATLNIKF